MTEEETMVSIENNPYLFVKAHKEAIKQRETGDDFFVDTPSCEADAHAFNEAYERIVKQKAMMNELERQQLRNRHYKAMKHEPIDVMRDWLTKEQFIGFCLGNAIKYLARYNAEGTKGGILNIDKAIDYLEWIQEATTEC